MKRSQRAATLIVLFGMGVLAPASLVWAQGQPGQVLNQQAAITQQFTNLYDLAFPASGVSDIVAAVRGTSTLLFVIFFIIYMVKLSKEIFKNAENWKELASFFSFLLFLGILLGPAGNTPPAIQLARGTLAVKDGLIQSVLRAQVINTSINIAIQTQVNNVQQQAMLRAKINQCEAIPATPVALPSATRPPSNSGTQLTRQQQAYYTKLECYQALEKDLQQILANAANPQLQQALDTLSATLALTFAAVVVPVGTPILLTGAALTAASGISNYAATYAGNDIINTIIWLANIFQYVFLLLLNVSYFLSILILPFVILMSVAPFVGSQGPLMNWLAGFVGLLATEFFYMVIVSIASIIQANVVAGNGANADLVIALIFGVFGPAIAASLAKLNATGAISAVSSGASQVAASVPAIGGTVASFARYRR